jgi:hypothetical protein
MNLIVKDEEISRTPMLDAFRLGDEIKALATRYLMEEEINAIARVIRSYHEDPTNWVERYFCLDKKFFQPCSLEQPKQGFINIRDLKPKDKYWSGLRRVLIYCNKYYLNIGRSNFENLTRDYVRRACDYVENSAKYLLTTIEPRAYTKRPLGEVIYTLKNSSFNLPRHLLEICEIFNQQIYTKAKHEHNLPIQEHLYTADEAILIYFMAKKLGTELQRLSTTC